MEGDRLVVICSTRLGKAYSTKTRKAKAVYTGNLLFCRCICGNYVVAYESNFLNGGTQSCGCLQKEQITERNKKHGHSSRELISPTYYSWTSMWKRCTDPKHDAYPRYGGRGITIDERWKDFRNFLEDMGERPYGTTIERKNNNNNYTKENCRWATPKEQAANRGENKWNCQTI